MPSCWPASWQAIHDIGISLPALHKPDAEANDPYLCLAFLLMLLRSSPWVDALYLLDPRPSTSGATLHPIVQASGVRDLHVTQPQDVTHALDMVIELGARLPVAWLRHVRALGARIVLYLVEQPYTRLMEKPIFAARTNRFSWSALARGLAAAQPCARRAAADAHARARARAY